MINKKKSGGLAKRYSASYVSKDGGSSSKGGVINYRKYDGEISFFSPAEGKHRINIIPYTIKSKNHPLVKRGEAEIGEMDYVMDFFVHRGIGPSEKSVLCLKNTYGKPCPICEHAAALRKSGKEKEANALKASRRVAYNIEDLKEPGKVKVFETSHYLFEKELIEEARDDEEGGFIDFADPEEGKEIKFRASKVAKNGMEFTEFKSFSFEDRDEKIDDELLEKAVSFDEILTVPTYEEVEKILYGDDEEDEEEEKPSKKSDEEDDNDDDDEEEKPVKKPSKKLEPVDDEEDDEEEEKPVKKSKPKAEPEEDEDENEDDEQEEEEKPAKKSESKPSKDCGECPYHHKYGTDCDETDDCDDCDIWHKCVKAKKD